MKRPRLRLLAAAFLALSWMGSSAALCLCRGPAAAAAAAHGCCDDAGLMPGDTHCCPSVSSAPARTEVVLRGHPALVTAAIAAVADRPAARTAASLPFRPAGPASSPPVVLRV